MNRTPDMPDLTMDPATLYREETITDQRIGTIRKLVPVTIDGRDDPARPVLYHGQTQLLTPAGPLPLNFEITAKTMSEAVAGFAKAAEQAIEQTMEELRELRRQTASSIVVPGNGGLPGAGGLGGVGAGGLPGGGKIKLP